MITRNIVVSLKLTQAENERLEFLMERLDKQRKSELIRYALKNLYNEVKA